jgi:hypothetical protein
MPPDKDLLGAPWQEPRSPAGRKSHKPTDAMRNSVEALAGVGTTHEEIARILGIDPTTLRKRYRVELDVGAAKANAKVALNLYAKATSDGREAVTAAMFWLRCRAGWSEYAPAQRGVEREPALGKKDAAQLAAETADAGTGWAGLVH